MQASGFELLEEFSGDEEEWVVAKAKGKPQKKPLPKEAEPKPAPSKVPPSQPQRAVKQKYVFGETPPPPGFVPKKMCAFYQQYGNCRMGDKCWYAHSKAELNKVNHADNKPNPHGAPSQSQPPVYKTQMCAFYPLGTCGKGAECTYAHSKKELRRYGCQPVHASNPAFPSNQGAADDSPFGGVTKDASPSKPALPNGSHAAAPVAATSPPGRPQPRAAPTPYRPTLQPTSSPAPAPSPLQSGTSLDAFLSQFPTAPGQAPPAGPSTSSRPQPSRAAPAAPDTAPQAPLPGSSTAAAAPHQADQAVERLAKLQLAPPSDVPDMLVCPITQEVFSDPVVAADGFTYERTAIEDWLNKNLTSPMTNEALPHKRLVPNFCIRQTIATFFAHVVRQDGV